MITDPSITSSAELQNPINPTLNREDILKKKIPGLTEGEKFGEVNLNNYSSETLNDKSKLEKNPNCIIGLEKETSTLLVRDQLIEKDSAGNETRYYVYNVVNKDKKFAAEETGFVPGKYLADDVDSSITLFLKKNITSAGQIENIEDARTAVLAGIISRKEYQGVEERIKNQEKQPAVAQPVVVEKPQEQSVTPQVTSIRNESNFENQKSERIIENINKKYLNEEVIREIKLFNAEVLQNLNSSINKFYSTLTELNNLNSKTIEEDMRYLIGTYQDEISPKLLEANKFLNKYSFQEINTDLRGLNNEISNLESSVSSTADENLKSLIRDKIKKLEETKNQLNDFKKRIYVIADEIRNYAIKTMRIFEDPDFKPQTLGFKPVQQMREEINNYVQSILRSVE
jgi:hypothetical protein